MDKLMELVTKTRDGVDSYLTGSVPAWTLLAIVAAIAVLNIIGHEVKRWRKRNKRRTRGYMGKVAEGYAICLTHMYDNGEITRSERIKEIGRLRASGLPMNLFEGSLIPAEKIHAHLAKVKSQIRLRRANPKNHEPVRSGQVISFK